MGNMALGHMVVTSQIEMTQLEMTDCWILRIGEVIDTGTILVLVLTGMMIDIVIILTRGVIRGIFWMSLRKKIHLHMMER